MNPTRIDEGRRPGAEAAAGACLVELEQQKIVVGEIVAKRLVQELLRRELDLRHDQPVQPVKRPLGREVLRLGEQGDREQRLGQIVPRLAARGGREAGIHTHLWQQHAAGRDGSRDAGTARARQLDGSCGRDLIQDCLLAWAFPSALS